MNMIAKRVWYLLRSTKGLTLMAVGIVSLVVAIWGLLSGPMVEWGVRDFVVEFLGMKLLPFEREGRIIMLYHSIAMIIVAIEVYFITDIVEMKPSEKATINATVTVGYLCAAIFGLLFGYFGHNYIFHGIFLFGQSLMFFGGLMLAAALWPWKLEYRISDPERARTKKNLDLERLAFFVMAVATLGSALFGAVAGSFYGNGFETFLAEDVIREPHKTPLQLAIIGHLHIMLTLIGVAITLIIGRWLDFRGIWHKLAMPSMIVGTIIITLGVWAVVPFEAIAHIIIYVGSVFVLLGGLFLVIFTWGKLIRERIAAEGIENPTLGQKLKALLQDPLKFGATWQMVFMNFSVTFIGLFMAAKLEDVMRVWPAREERITLTGHWHILATIIATIMLFYFADKMGLKGRARKWFGWIVIVGSDVAFAAVTAFSIKRLFVSELAQQRFVNATTVLADTGLAIVLIALAAFLIWRLVDLGKRRGSWSEELIAAGIDDELPEGK
jgi:MFS family permease